MNSTIALDEYPNNIKTTAFGTWDSTNPWAAQTSVYQLNKSHNAIITNTSYDGRFPSGFDSAENIQIFTGNGTNGLFWDATPDRNAPNTPGMAGLWGLLAHEGTHWLATRAHSAFGFGDMMSLYSYTGVGVRSMTQSVSRYFSLDGGVTNWAFANSSTGDFNGYSDSRDPGSDLAFNHSVEYGTNQRVGFSEVQVLSAHGIPLTKVGLIAAGLPAASGTPVISGIPAVGQTLTATTAGWTGDTKKGGLSTAFSWKRNGVPIASGSSYVVQGNDVGNTITVTETATNWVGTDNLTSAFLDIPGGGTPRGGMSSKLWTHT